MLAVLFRIGGVLWLLAAAGVLYTGVFTLVRADILAILAIAAPLLLAGFVMFGIAEILDALTRTARATERTAEAVERLANEQARAAGQKARAAQSGPEGEARWRTQ